MSKEDHHRVYSCSRCKRKSERNEWAKKVRRDSRVHGMKAHTKPWWYEFKTPCRRHWCIVARRYRVEIAISKVTFCFKLCTSSITSPSHYTLLPATHARTAAAPRGSSAVVLELKKELKVGRGDGVTWKIRACTSDCLELPQGAARTAADPYKKEKQQFADPSTLKRSC